jgi:predicted CXXCH cytochrome family protein
MPEIHRFSEWTAAAAVTRRALSLAALVLLASIATPDRSALGAAGFAETGARGVALRGEDHGGAPKIEETRHDLSVEGAATCPMCHVVDSTRGGIDPEWDPQGDSGAFSTYTDPDAAPARPWRPQGVSLVCLSCHDGMIGPDRVITTQVAAVASGAILADYRTVFLGEHPISVSYGLTEDRLRTTALNVNAYGRAGGVLPLFGSQRSAVECASCHNAHYETFDAFLRVTAAQSTLCTTCHRK